jgi:hypothetical protein
MKKKYKNFERFFAVLEKIKKLIEFGFLLDKVFQRMIPLVTNLMKTVKIMKIVKGVLLFIIANIP